MSTYFRWAVIFLIVSAALYVLAVIPILLQGGSFDGEAITRVVVGLCYAVLALALSRGWRWIGYIAFFVSFIGGIVAISGIWAASPIPSWWYLAILIANWLCAAALFLGLWSKPDPAKLTTS